MHEIRNPFSKVGKSCVKLVAGCRAHGNAPSAILNRGPVGMQTRLVLALALAASSPSCDALVVTPGAASARLDAGRSRPVSQFGFGAERDRKAGAKAELSLPKIELPRIELPWESPLAPPSFGPELAADFAKLFVAVFPLGIVTFVLLGILASSTATPFNFIDPLYPPAVRENQMNKQKLELRQAEIKAAADKAKAAAEAASKAAAAAAAPAAAAAK